MNHAERSYPHEGGCPECAYHKLCNVCGEKYKLTERCTNGRCLRCHAKVCTPGLAHGYGFPKKVRLS